MSQIYDLPDEPMSAGTGFDYTRWDGKISHVSLHRVPWSNDYRDIAWFDTTRELVEYLDSQPTLKGFETSYLKYGQPVKIDVPFNEALKYNYLAVFNPQQPIDSNMPDSARWLFYFISDVVYLSPNTTQLILQVDISQTFLRQVQFGQAYAEQGHVGVADSRVGVNKHDILTQPEGLNLGADYIPVRYRWLQIAESDDYSIVVVTTISFEGDHGTVDDPKLETATGSDFEGLPNGAEIYIFRSVDQFKSFMSLMKSEPWITQGIVSVTAVPSGLVNDSWQKAKLPSRFSSLTDVLKPQKRDTLPTHFYEAMPDFDKSVMDHVDSRYKHLKKFTVYPYSFIELSTYTGEPLVLKPELWRDDNKRVIVKFHIAPPSPRVGIRPFNYGSLVYRGEIKDGDDPDKLDGSSEGWNVATWLANFPQFSVVNNGYLTTMASQAHSIQQSYKDAGWQQQRALTGNQLAYDQSSAAMGLANDMTQNQVTHMGEQTALSNRTAATQGMVNAAGQLIGGVGGGPLGMTSALAGAMQTGANTALNIHQASQSTAMQQQLASAQNALQVGNQGYVRDTNKNFADYATRGDYQNAINSINAKVEDAKLTQPTSAGTTGGDAFQLAIRGWAIHGKIKMPPRGAQRAIGEYWLRYGYAINRFVSMPRDLRCMTIFTYWKVKETYILQAQCPEPIKQALRGIFEKGVTVWHEPSMIGNPSALEDNAPVPGHYIEGVAS